MDFFTLKGSVETLLNRMRIRSVRFAACKDNAAYHPGRCAEVFSGETRLGVLGQLHPLTASNYDMDCEVFCAELDFDGMIALRGAEPTYTPLPRFPAITRDIALVCDEGLTVGELTECIRSAGAEVLKGVALFDVYTGPGIPQGKKSVAFSLTLRSDDSTLTDDHAEEAMGLILGALKERLGAVIR